MKKMTQLFFQGLLVILPLAITASFLYWFFVSAEKIFTVPLQKLLPAAWYIPGMGLLAAVLFTLAVGLLLRIYFIKLLLQWFEGQLNRLPLVKQVYGGVRDLVQFFSGRNKNELQKVVAVEISGMRLIGFVTGENVTLGKKEKLLSVYFPMSYQVGGYLVYLPESECEVLDIPAQEAMQKVLTANISNNP